jgi:hypothetical protein
LEALLFIWKFGWIDSQGWPCELNSELMRALISISHDVHGLYVA